jgi:hypothetical protein
MDKLSFKIVNTPILVVSIGTCDVIASDLYKLLEKFVDDDEINNYELSVTLVDTLVSIGVLKIEAGERQAILYCKTDKFESFYDSFMNEYYQNI